MFKRIFTFLIILAIPGTLAAGNPGDTAFNFVKIGISPRAAGMGEAFTSSADDASSTYWNPAGLIQLKRYEISLNHTSWFEQINFQNLCIATPRSKHGAFGFAVYRLGRDDIQGYDSGGSATSKLNFSDTAASFSFAYPVPWFDSSAGITTKYIQEDIAGDKTSSIAFDIGYMGKFSLIQLTPVKMGIAVKNIGPKVKHSKESYGLPLSITCGFSAIFLHESLLAGADYTLPNDNDGYIAVGMEFKPLPYTALRAGYRSQTTHDDDLTDGLRCGIGLGNRDLSIDYAYAPYGDLGDTHRFGISMRFGLQYRADKYQRRIDRHIANARRYYALNNLAQANEHISMALTLDPSNQEAAFLCKKIAQEVDSINIKRYLLLAESLIERDELAEAKSVCERMLKLKPDLPEAVLLLEEIDKYLAQEKEQRINILLKQGEEFFEKESYTDAIELWEKILLIDAGNQEVNARIDDAREKQIQQQLEKERLYIELLMKEAQEAFDKNRVERANELLRRIIKKKPEHDKAKELLETVKKELLIKHKAGSDKLLQDGIEQFENNNMEKAHQMFKEALELFPENEKASGYFQKTKSHLDAVSFEKAQEANKKGLAAYASGDIKQAIKYFEEAIEHSPDYEEAKNNLERARRELEQ